MWAVVLIALKFFVVYVFFIFSVLSSYTCMMFISCMYFGKEQCKPVSKSEIFNCLRNFNLEMMWEKVTEAIEQLLSSPDEFRMKNKIGEGKKAQGPQLSFIAAL